MKKILPGLIAAMLLTSGCIRPDPDPVVLADSTPQLSIQGRLLFRYEESSCQLGFNRDRAEFRMHTDNMSDYVFVTLDHIPSSVGEKVIANDMSWTTTDDVEYRIKLILEVLKLEDGNIWLWSSRERISLVIRELGS